MITCYKCDICRQNNYRPMMGDGNSDAAIMFVSRNPLAKDHKADVPFVGKDGEYFQLFLDVFGFHRDDIFITNAVKCKTPYHRMPSEVELTHCRDYLLDEIKQVNPKIVVLLGLTPFRSYFNLIYHQLNVDMFMLNNKVIIHDNRVILLMHHPSHALTNKAAKIGMFYSFVNLVNMYRIINPFHTTLIGI